MNVFGMSLPIAELALILQAITCIFLVWLYRKLH